MSPAMKNTAPTIAPPINKRKIDGLICRSCPLVPFDRLSDYRRPMLPLMATRQVRQGIDLAVCLNTGLLRIIEPQDDRAILVA